MKPAVLVRKSGELPLSGDSLTELLRAVLAKGKPFRFRAGGSSMSPFIKDGDIVIVSPLLGRKPRTGEVVAFLHPGTGKVAVHRIVRKKTGWFFLRGDNSFSVDGALTFDRVLGSVTRVERQGRRVRGMGGRLSPAVALLSRTGGLVRGLSFARRLNGQRTRRGRDQP
jgi:Peptidase S24-like